MEISILLAERIIAMFLTMAVGFGVYSDDRTDRNCSPGSSNGHTACTDL